MAQTGRNDAIKRLESGKMVLLVPTGRCFSKVLIQMTSTHIFQHGLTSLRMFYLHRIGR